MASKGGKLLEQMRGSKAGWGRRDLDRLYKSFGFHIRHGSAHDIVIHPKYPFLRATLPRHSSLARGYVEYAVKLVDKLMELEKGE